MKSQNKTTSKNSNSNLNHSINNQDKGLHPKDQSADKFHDIDYLKGFNDYVLEGFDNKNFQKKEKK